MRDGAHIGTNSVSDIEREDIIRMMVGRELKDEFPPREATIGEERTSAGKSISKKCLFQCLLFASCR